MHADGAHGISTEQLDALRASVCTRAAGCRHFIPLLFCAAAAAAAMPRVVALGGIAAIAAYTSGATSLAAAQSVSAGALFLVLRAGRDDLFLNAAIALVLYALGVSAALGSENDALWRAHLGAHARDCPYHRACLCGCAQCADPETPAHARDSRFGVLDMAAHRDAVWRAENCVWRNLLFVAVQFAAVVAYIVPVHGIVRAYAPGAVWAALPCAAAGAAAVQMAFAGEFRAAAPDFAAGMQAARPWVSPLFSAVLGAFVAEYWALMCVWDGVLGAAVLAALAACVLATLLAAWAAIALLSAHYDAAARWEAHLGRSRNAACTVHRDCLCACKACGHSPK